MTEDEKEAFRKEFQKKNPPNGGTSFYQFWLHEQAINFIEEKGLSGQITPRYLLD